MSEEVNQVITAICEEQCMLADKVLYTDVCSLSNNNSNSNSHDSVYGAVIVAVHYQSSPGSGQLSLLPSAGWEMSSSLRATG